MRVPAPRPLLRAQRRIKALQRKAARQLGPFDPVLKTARAPSARWRRTQRRLGRLHSTTANIRHDLLHKATTALATSHEVIVVETLHVAGLGSAGGSTKRGLNRALTDAALASVRRMLRYKTAWYASTLVEASRWFPSSKLSPR